MSSLAPLATSSAQDVEDILEGFQDIPTIPDVLVRIWKIVDDPRSSSQELERAVSMEAPLAAKVLRLANSPYFGGRGDVSDVHAAIRILGFRTIQNLAVCLTVAQRLVQQEEDGDLDPRALWRHGVATAVIARRLARGVENVHPDEAFTAGLLHDLGIFVLNLGLPQAYGEVLARSDPAWRLDRAEREVLGFDHATLGAAFARQWGFPAALQDALRLHHDDGANSDDLPGVVRAADAVSHALDEVQIFPGAPGGGVSCPTLTDVGLDEAWLHERRDSFYDDIRGAQEFMNLL